MATTTSGLRFPISSDDPDIPRDIRQLAEDVDDFLNATGTGAFNGVLPAIDINGNATTATTATQLATARTISLGGSLSGSASFDGSADITITATNQISAFNAQTGTTYTFVATDVGKTVTSDNASPQTYTIPPQASVGWLANTTLNVLNFGVGVVTFVGGAGVTVTNAVQTLTQFQSARLIRTASDAWTVTPDSGGAGGGAGLQDIFLLMGA